MTARLNRAGDPPGLQTAFLKIHIFIPVLREPQYNTTDALLFLETGDKEV
jgi:hypothetical protein